MKRAITLLTILIGLLAVAPAQASPGWELPQVSTFVGGDRELPNTTYARHCGASRFGVYRFVIGVTDRGRQGTAVWRVRLSGDGAAHRPRRLTFHGYLSKRLRRATVRLLRNVDYRVAGAPAQVQGVFRKDGAVQASRAFDPRPRACR